MLVGMVEVLGLSCGTGWCDDIGASAMQEKCTSTSASTIAAVHLAFFVVERLAAWRLRHCCRARHYFSSPGGYVGWDG
jgi:hypothetical protein